MSLDDGSAGVQVLAFIHHVKVFDQEQIVFPNGGVNAWNCLRLLARLIDPALGIQSCDLPVAAKNVDDGPFVIVIGITVLRVGLADQGIRA